jgi:hypothetical protein
VAFKEAKPPLQRWAEHEGQFPRVTFLARAMSGILGSQIHRDSICVFYSRHLHGPLLMSPWCKQPRFVNFAH